MCPAVDKFSQFYKNKMLNCYHLTFVVPIFSQAAGEILVICGTFSVT